MDCDFLCLKFIECEMFSANENKLTIPLPIMFSSLIVASIIFVVMFDFYRANKSVTVSINAENVECSQWKFFIRTLKSENGRPLNFSMNNQKDVQSFYNNLNSQGLDYLFPLQNSEILLFLSIGVRSHRENCLQIKWLN
jgi:hypothetical protein